MLPFYARIIWFTVVTGSTYNAHGAIDELRFYDKVLSNDDINTLVFGKQLLDIGKGGSGGGAGWEIFNTNDIEKIYPPNRFSSVITLIDLVKFKGIIDNNDYGNGNYIIEASITHTDTHRPWHAFDTNVSNNSLAWGIPLIPAHHPDIDYETYNTNNGVYAGTVKTTSNQIEYFVP